MPTNVDSILQQAAEALKNKQYPQAEDLQRQACEILREQAAEESRLAAELETLADIHCTQRKFEACANEYAEVVQLREKLLPENDYNILRPLYRLAKSHFEDQKYESAEGEMRRALALAETRYDSPESVAFCLYELGWLLYYVESTARRSHISSRLFRSARQRMVPRIIKLLGCSQELHSYTAIVTTLGRTLNHISERSSTQPKRKGICERLTSQIFVVWRPILPNTRDWKKPMNYSCSS
jgi:tetratricopeptide (TPR) repeat protein